MTTGKIKTTEVSCEDVIWSISSWAATKLTDDELHELYGADTTFIAEKACLLYDMYGGTDLTLGSLLACTHSPLAEEGTKKLVHHSALREALNCVSKAYAQFPRYAAEGRVAAYRAYLERIERGVVAARAAIFSEPHVVTSNTAVALS